MILGPGSGQSGYGQSVTSAGVVQGDKIRLTDWVNLRSDMILARQHQTGVSVGTKSPTDPGYVAGQDLILPTNSFTVTEQLRAQYNTFADTITSDKFLIGSTQFSPEALLTTQRGPSQDWNGTLTNVVTVQFASADQARYFFNAGGIIKILSTITGDGGASNDKNNTWNVMLSQTGTVSFGVSVTADGSSPGTCSLGYHSLTTSDQRVYYKAPLSGSYTLNDYSIYAKLASGGAQVVFTINYEDNAGPNPNYDENVTGTLINTVSMNRPSGSNVTLAAPTASRSGNMIP